MELSWYQYSLRVIDRVVDDFCNENEIERWRFPLDKLPELKAQLFEAYPFGERNRHPYKMWLKAQKLTLTMLASGKNVKPSSANKRVVCDPNQLNMFG